MLSVNELEAKYAASKLRYEALAGTLIYLHKRFTDEGEDCSHLLHALNAASMIVEGEVSELLMADMAKLGQMFLESRGDKSIAE